MVVPRTREYGHGHDGTGDKEGAGTDHGASARDRHADRSRLLERRGGSASRDLAQDCQGALRRVAAEARCEASAADSDRVPTSDRRRPACLGTPLADGCPTPPLIECARGYSRCRGRHQISGPAVLGSQRGSSPPGSYGKYRDSRHSAATPRHPAAATPRAAGRIAGSREDARGSGGLREDDSGRAVGRYRRPPAGVVHRAPVVDRCRGAGTRAWREPLQSS